MFVDNEGSNNAGGPNPGLPDVTVSLETTSGGTVTDASRHTVASTTTDSSGNYSFSNLNAGTYKVVVSDPTGYLLEGSSTSTFTETVSTPGPDTMVNEGVYQDASLSGTVTSGSSGLSGVSVEITDLEFNDLGSTTTGTAGTYTLDDLAPGTYGIQGAGTYQLQFVIPLGDMGAAFSTQNASTDPTTSSSANSSGYTSDFTVTDGEVWLAENVGLMGISV